MAALTVFRPYLETAATPGPGAKSIGTGTACSSGGDTFANDGRTILRLTSTHSADQTATIAPAVTSTVPYATYKTWAFVVPLTSGDIVTRTFEPTVYNNAAGDVSITYSGVTTLKIWVISASGG